ncbi:hypothetical protein F5Y17DRAFT_433956 [Xylariaceae sp. FL0594]|nr:hypothetical protein F5Y17DRAFT_433956 [Xylariaceae sp. FL0594]
MPPLIVHNVPDEELYMGEDGIQRPYAMVWPEGDRQRSAPRTRARELNETGSFGKSTRRSRSRTGSVQPRREDATMRAADEIFSQFISRQQQKDPNPTEGSNRKSRPDDPAATEAALPPHKEPVEVILRGYASPAQQYAAINQYEQLAGRICEDYSREPPVEARRYKSELRDPALRRRQPLTKSEREKVNKVAGGEHWIKVTFESQEAADAALYASPQEIMGHLVYAEPYHSRPPVENAAVLNVVGDVGMLADIRRSSSFRERPGRTSQSRNSISQTLPRSLQPAQPDGPVRRRAGSPFGSQSASQTMDTATATIPAATVTGLETEAKDKQQQQQQKEEEETQQEAERPSGRIRGARRITLLPADAALKRQPSFAERMLALIPLLGWFSGAVIGDEVPRTELGEFDLNRASLYWKFLYWLDYWFRLFGNELVGGDKED